MKIGDKAIRECNDHIGLRLLQENQKGPTEACAQTSQEKSVTVSTASPVIVVGDGMTVGRNAECSLPHDKTTSAGRKR